MNLFNVLKGFVFVPNDRSGVQLNIPTQQTHCNISANKTTTELSPICPMPHFPWNIARPCMGSCAGTF